MNHQHAGPQGATPPAGYQDFSLDPTGATGPQGVMDAIADPTDYDVLLLDVTATMLHQDVARHLNVEYLSDAPKELVSPRIQGTLFGPFDRPMIAMHVERGDVAKVVLFLVDTGSPSTYLCDEALQALNVTVQPGSPFSVRINGYSTRAFMSPPEKHFNDVNLIGTDYLRTFRIIFSIDFNTTDPRPVTLTFPETYTTIHRD